MEAFSEFKGLDLLQTRRKLQRSAQILCLGPLTEFDLVVQEWKLMQSVRGKNWYSIQRSGVMSVGKLKLIKVLFPSSAVRISMVWFSSDRLSQVLSAFPQPSLSSLGRWRLSWMLITASTKHENSSSLRSPCGSLLQSTIKLYFWEVCVPQEGIKQLFVWHSYGRVLKSGTLCLDYVGFCPGIV